MHQHCFVFLQNNFKIWIWNSSFSLWFKCPFLHLLRQSVVKKKEYSVMVCYFKYLNCFWELFWHTSKQKLQCFWTWKQAVPHSYTFTEINNKTHNPFTVIHKETDSIDVTVQVQITQLERIVQSTFPPTNTCTAVISWPWS